MGQRGHHNAGSSQHFDQEGVSTSRSSGHHSTQRREDHDDNLPVQNAAARAQWDSIISRDTREELLNQVVHFIISSSQSGLPIKRSDINKHVLKENNKAFSIVIEKAATKLMDVFGFCLNEIDAKKGIYVLGNEHNISMQTNNPFALDNIEFARKGLLLSVLSAIFMNQQALTESALWKFLNGLGLDKDMHDCGFGSGTLKNLITVEWARQGYLEISKLQGTDPPDSEVKWGPRASCEINKRDVLQFVSTVYGNDINDWTEYAQLIH